MDHQQHLTQEELISAIAEIDQAIYGHEQWLEEVMAALICKLPADKRDLNDEAWRNCRFGQWYYTKGMAKLADRASFREVENEHKKMHQHASSLLRATAEKTPISLDDYERFLSALKRMRLEILSLKRELEVSLYNIDALTGVPGRLQLLEKLRENREFVVRGVHRCTIAMLDVDNFKTVNDVHGHQVGDHVLQAIASYVQSHLRQYDVLFRYGGEEFLLCMPNTDLKLGREICDRLRSELASLRHEDKREDAFQVTVSIGLAELDADCSVEEAVNRADQALFAAKGAGRNRVVVWEAPKSENRLVA